jgi:hypothetical protein
MCTPVAERDILSLQAIAASSRIGARLLAFYGIRSQRQLVERLEFDLLFP